ncbi:DUF2510 domain-containing protein [Rhodococcus sp. BP-332]|uniref:DUF2510 domain-containing protein n=1 Tax=Rhodococcus sp. BP-332 TaxID=2739447 RepID=UPI001C9B7901|nr:DUF2510 domain-containing protein [Rhodococcus sp. BP-332]MBY6678239.1 DUF2510 domain-containing protein [Rhodococcus sp. BP-332]
MTEGGAPAGWFDDGHGSVRWWDGTQWTEHVQPAARSANSFTQSAARLGRSVLAKDDPSSDPNALWSAVGKPLSGIGGGRYKLTAEYLHFERGTISTRAQQIRTHEIHDVDASQTMTQKARGVGTIVLWANRTGSGQSERVELVDVPNFREGVALLNRVSNEARDNLRLKERTQTVNYSSAVPARDPAPVNSAKNPDLDLNSEIAKLAAYRETGILTEDEFIAAKRKLLGLE